MQEIKNKNEKLRLKTTLDNLGWGLFLIMLGLITLLPDAMLPEGSFLIGVGIILLGLNYIKYSKNIQVNKFTIFIGLVALLSGVSDNLGFDVDIFPIILILWGLSIIYKYFKK